MSELKIELRELSLFDGEDIIEMLREIGPGENGFNNNPFDMNSEEFKVYLIDKFNNSKGTNLKENMVPQTMCWLYVNNKPVGVGKLREYLNEGLRKKGGHIGYCIRPSERGKGYGNLLLEELLKKAGEKNIPKVLLTCSDTNKASSSVMEHNGGILEKIENNDCYYWIELQGRNGIRVMHIDDYDEALNLWKNTSGMGISDADSREKILGFLKRNKGMSYCYISEGKIVGTVLCGHDGRRGYIYHAAVADEYRGKGIGKALVSESFRKLKEEGIEKCHLFVYTDNEPGKLFWSATGWIKREDIYVYTKSIL